MMKSDTDFAPTRQAKMWMLPVACLTFLLGATVVQADGAAPDLVQELRAHITAEQAQLHALDGEVAAARQRSRVMEVADLFGESDEEKAARLQHEQNQDANIATLQQRIGDVEDSLRRLTGQLEQLDHRLSQMNDRITHMQKDFDYKLCSLAAQQLGASADTGDQGGLPCGSTQQGTGQQGNPSSSPATMANGGSPPPASDTSVHLGRPPGILGTLPQSAVGNPPPDGGSQQGAPSNAKPQFDAARNLLAEAQYDGARAAFRSFADSHPDDSLAPQAVYWVGAIAYVQKDYANAARAFAEELKKYPDNPRAAQSLLKLGQSLIALNQKKEGCTALGALPSKYPTAAESIADQALAARKAAGCR